MPSRGVSRLCPVLAVPAIVAVLVLRPGVAHHSARHDLVRMMMPGARREVIVILCALCVCLVVVAMVERIVPGRRRGGGLILRVDGGEVAELDEPADVIVRPIVKGDVKRRKRHDGGEPEKDPEDPS